MESPYVIRNLEFVINNGKRTSYVKQLILCVVIWLTGLFFQWLSVFLKVSKLRGNFFRRSCL